MIYVLLEAPQQPDETLKTLQREVSQFRRFSLEYEEDRESEPLGEVRKNFVNSQGAHSVVVKATQLLTGKVCAVKKIRSDDECILESSRKEYEILKILENEKHIVRCYDFFIDAHRGRTYLVLE